MSINFANSGKILGHLLFIFLIKGNQLK